MRLHFTSLLVCLLSTSAGLAQKPPVDLDSSPGRTSALQQMVAEGDTIAVTWEDDRQGGSSLYANRSIDRGQTWLAMDVAVDGPGPNAVEAGSHRTAIAGNSIHIVWSDSRNGENDVYYRRSLDGGATWVGPAQRLDTDVAGSARSHSPRIAVVGTSVYVAWLDLRQGSTPPIQDVYFSCSHDGGSTWLASEVRLTQSTASSSAGSLELAAAGSSVYAAWMESGNGAYTVQLNRSLDQGATWWPSARRIDRGEGFVPSIAAEGTAVHITWTVSRSTPIGSANALYYNVSYDGGTNWLVNDIRLDSSLLGSASDSRIALVGSHVYVAWSDAEDLVSGGSVRHSARFNRSTDRGNTWLPSETVLQSSLLASPFAIAASPELLSACVSTPSGLLNYSSTDAGSSWSHPIGLAGVGGEGRIAVSDSNAYAAWYVRGGFLNTGPYDIGFSLLHGTQRYGASLPGSGSQAPALASTGVALPGEFFTLDLFDGLGAAPGFLLMGLGANSRVSIPQLGGVQLVDPTVIVAFRLGGPSGIPGAGSQTFNFLIPNVTPPATNLNLQALILDSGASQGVSMSSGLELWIG